MSNEKQIMKMPHPVFVDEGQVVWARFPELGHWYQCKVVAAMGDTARVVNEKQGIDTWFHIGELHVPQSA